MDALARHDVGRTYRRLLAPQLTGLVARIDAGLRAFEQEAREPRPRAATLGTQVNAQWPDYRVAIAALEARQSALRRTGALAHVDIAEEANTDAFIREVIQGPEFQRPLGTDEFHHLLGKYVCERGRKLGVEDNSVLASAYECGIPVFTSSPGDSSIGMNVAAMALRDSKLIFDVNRDVNQTAAIVYEAKSTGHTSGVFILGGGSPKNFVLQTEPQIQEVLGIPEDGHDYFLQCTDARPDTGGLSGATPAEAVSWGKVDPDTLPDCVVCYADSTIALPLLTAYCVSRVTPRKLKRLYHRRDPILDKVKLKYLKTGTVTKVMTSRRIAKRATGAGLKKGGIR